ncbi:methyl-accepting chemotaxis protein [Bacillus sp. T33-2]|uniref:methyl-accepting chemotaxis protein n=1 Tax=Bacillus sp. T33-2 TaxID=2054168 RepID=UPI0035B504F7
MRYPGNWKVKDGKLYKGSTMVNNNEEMVDYIAGLTNGTVTIFLEDTRVATNVVNEGKRAVGTQASEEVVKQTLKGGKNYYGEAVVVGNQYQTAYQPIKDHTGKTLGMWYVGAPVDMVSDAIAHINIILFSSLAGLIVVGLIIILPFTNRMKKRLFTLGEALEQAGEGNFTVDVADSTGDEISTLAASYRKMRGNLSGLVMQIREAAETVAASAEELNAGAEETARATDSIASSVQEVASSAEQQAAHTNQLNETVHSLTKGIKSIAVGAGQVQKSTEENTAAAKNGVTIMEKTRNQVMVINEMTNSTSAFIQHLNEKSKEIGNIINMITAISEQTNLLALNAAIEAARAGEHGRGFAVVAEEVRKLAEQSSVSAGQIRELIVGIQQDISRSVESMENGRSAISEGIELAGSAEESFTNISNSIGDIHGQAGLVSQSVNEMDRGTGQMLQVLQEIVVQIGQTSEAAQTVASATEQQNASMQEVNAFSQSLSSLAEELRNSVSRFKL